ncbi:hypothetical protein [Phyllobacterium sp. SB3]|uniref:S10 family serine carboxypeptidase-like protein n=1 Tax=Phyllobacterium sp. SB3 TaxID=3156073 RepID=UPI0032AEE162
MNYRYLLLFAALAIAACDGSDSSVSLNENSTSSFPSVVETQTPPKVSPPLQPNKIDQLTDAQKKDLVLEAAALVRAGNREKAIGDLKAAGLVKSGEKDTELRQTERLFADANLLEEAYILFAPDDYVLNDTTTYDGLPDASLPVAVDERPSVKRHSMTLNGKKLWYTASSGHLTAFDKNPEKEGPEVSVFYTSYTRDDLPKENRPVTFFFNGGPGASSIYLHLASFAPKRVFTDGPNVPAEWANGRPQSFPVIEDKESLIDKSDLVFVDPIPGTGFSQAIAPNTNKSFWGVSEDIKISRDFITRYVNVNNRQTSPKYLYGESYGGGIRVPKLAHAMVKAGTSGFEKTSSNNKPVVLTGVVFHSPAFNYDDDASADYLPTFAMVADHLKKTTVRGGKSLDEFAELLRDFTANTYVPSLSPNWWEPPTSDISAYTGASVDDYPSVNWYLPALTDILKPGYAFNAYDARMHVKKPLDKNGKPTDMSYDFDFFEEDALHNVITTYLPDEANYKPKSSYLNASWQTTDPGVDRGPKLAFELWKTSEEKNGLPDIVAALGYDPSLKLITVHGYYDAVTTFYQSERQLKGVVFDKGTNKTLLDRVPVKNFAGGHMIYYSEEARVPLKQTLDQFYDAPPYGTPASITAPMSSTLASRALPIAATR